jgi:hypothetical protein
MYLGDILYQLKKKFLPCEQCQNKISSDWKVS